MNLIVDIGNTLVKAAVFQKASLIYKQAFVRAEFFQKMPAIFNAFPELKHSILSSVVKNTEAEEEFLESRLQFMKLSNELRQPFRNNYGTPATLGKDRIALVCAAVNKYPSRNVLVVDAGTCVTYDFKDKEEKYKGGAISPGLRMRYEALHKFTGNLPLLKEIDEVKLIGNTTEASIHSGVVNGLVLEIDAVINSYKTDYKDLTVILTGGDNQFLLKRLKNTIFANPNFLLEGLNHILEFNKTQ